MKFECGDLERALANSDLFPEAREHLKTCAVCRREYRLWNDISSVARELHEEWDTPALWPTIRQAIEAERKPERTSLRGFSPVSTGSPRCPPCFGCGIRLPDTAYQNQLDVSALILLMCSMCERLR